MASDRVLVFQSGAELRSWAGAWDDLWRRSPVANPRARAALVANWIDHFAPRSGLRIVAIERNGRLITALPLVKQRLRGVLPVLTLPGCEWGLCGDLLLDMNADTASALELLARQLGTAGWPMLWFEAVAIDRPEWQQLFQALEKVNCQISVRPKFTVGLVELDHDWHRYEAEYPKRQRRNRRRQATALEKAGGAELSLLNAIASGDAPAMIRRGFDVESKSWKGKEGTAVVDHPKVLDFYSEEAIQLAEWGLLELAFLEFQDRPIAFEYGFHAKGVHFVPKVGYDETYAKFAPGMQLMLRVIRRQQEDPWRRMIDFDGPLAPWTEDLSTSTYRLARVVVGADQWQHRLLMRGYDRWFPRLRNLLGRKAVPASPEPEPVEHAQA